MSTRSGFRPGNHLLTLCLLIPLFTVLGKDPGSAPEKGGLMDRIMNPDRNAPSSLDGKEFHSGKDFHDKTFKTGEFATGSSRDKGNFLTKPFAGIRDALLGKKEAPLKELPDRFGAESRYSSKAYGSKAFATKEFDGGDKVAKGAGSVFETRDASVRGTVQGAFDNNPDLREAVKKGLSVDDVRKLLNKTP